MTNHIALRTVEEMIADFTPSYAPIMPLFLDNAVAYSQDVGNVSFRRATTVGDTRNKFVGPKDTELHQIHSKEGSKVFKKYFMGSQYIQSQLQDVGSYEDVVGEVLDEHNKQADELLLFGEGTSNGDVVNSGLFYSNDPNYQLKSSVALAKDGNGSYLPALYTTMVSAVQEAQEIDGEILVMSYGDTQILQVNGQYPNTNVAFAASISDALEDVNFAKMPKSITPAGVNGFIVINVNKVKLHYMTLPKVLSQGVNEEKMYGWTNFLMGSSMVEVIAKNAITRQPLTFTP